MRKEGTNIRPYDKSGKIGLSLFAVVFLSIALLAGVHGNIVADQPSEQLIAGGDMHNYTGLPLQFHMNVTGANTTDVEAWLVLNAFDTAAQSIGPQFDLNQTRNWSMTGQNYTVGDATNNTLFSVNLTTNFSSPFLGPGPHSVWFCSNQSPSGHNCSGPYDFSVMGVNVTQMEESFTSSGIGGPFQGMDVRFGNGTDLTFSEFMNPNVLNYTMHMNFSDRAGIYIVGMSINASALSNANSTNFTGEISSEVQNEVGGGFDANLTWVDIGSFIPSELAYEFGIIQMPDTFSEVYYCNGTTTANPSCDQISLCNATAVSMFNHTDVIPTESACYLNSGSWGVNATESTLESGFTYLFVDHFSGGLGANDFSNPNVTYNVPSADLNTTTAAQSINFSVFDLDSTGLNLSKNASINLTVFDSAGAQQDLFSYNTIDTNLSCITPDSTSTENTTTIHCNLTYAFMNGSFTLNVTGRDTSNNSNAINVTGSSLNVTVDQIPPGISTITSKSVTVVNVTANFSATDPLTITHTDRVLGVSSASFTTNCSGSGSYTSGTAFHPFNASGGACTGESHVTLTVNATDVLGNSNLTTYVFGVDTVAPSVGTASLTPGVQVENPVNISVEANESFSRISSIAYFLDGGSRTEIDFDESGLNFSSSNTLISNTSSTLSLGSHSILFEANDTLGNARNGTAFSFTVLGDQNFTDVNKSIVAYNADVSNTLIRNSSGDVINGGKDRINQTLEIYIETGVTSNLPNVTLNFNGSAASWKDINFSVESNDSSINTHVNNNQTVRVIDSIYLNGSIQHFLPDNNTYYGNVSFPLNATANDFGFKRLLYFEDHGDLATATNITACASGQVFGQDNTTGLPCWNDIGEQRVDIIVPHFSVVAVVNDSVPPTISRNFPEATQTLSEFAPNITVSADATSCLYFLNNSASSVTNASSAQSGSISPSGQECAFTPIRFKDGDYNITFNVTDSSGNLNSTTFDFTVADATAPNNGTSISASGSKSGGTVTITGVNESVNATVFFGTTVAASGGTGTQTDFSQSQSVSISRSTVSTATVIHYNVSLCDFNGNCNLTSNLTFTQSATSSDDSSDDSSSSSSSGGGGGSVVSTNVVATTGQQWATIPLGSEIAMTVSNSQIAVTGVRFVATAEMRDAGIDVSSLKENPVSLAPEGTAYQFLQFLRSDLADGNFEESVEIDFVVPTSWLSDNDVDAQDVKLFRYEGGEWNVLETSISDRDSGNVRYTAITPGFSYFMIASQSAPSEGRSSAREDETSSSTQTAGETDQEGQETSRSGNQTDTQAGGEGSSASLWWALGLIVVVIIGFVAWRYQREREQDKKF